MVVVLYYGVVDGVVWLELVFFCEKLVDEEVFVLISVDSVVGDVVNYLVWCLEFELVVIVCYDDLVDSFVLDLLLVIGIY